MEWLDARGLDPELCDRLGLASRGASGSEVLIYPFVRKGEIVGRKYRALDQKEGGRRFWRDPGDTLCAYNEDCLRDDSLLDQPLVITEGQDDCIAVLQAGHARCISVPDGAPQKPVDSLEDSKKYEWIDQAADLLRMDRVREIIIAADGDAAGAALLHDLSVKLIKARCKFVTYPRTKNAAALGRDRLKDMNEVLGEYGPEAVRIVLARAAFLRVNGVYSMGELPPMPDSVIYDIGFEALSAHLRIRLGDLSVWTGVPSHGKTTALNDIICRITKRYGIVSGWASFEQDPQRDHRRALRSWHAEEYEPKLDVHQLTAADEWIENHFRFLVPGDDEDPTLEWLIEKMEVAVIQHGCKILVADPWNEAVHERAHGESETDYTNRSLRTLKKFAKRFQVHVAVVAHPTKLGRQPDGTFPVPSLYDVSGSAAWYNKPDQGIIVHRLTADETIIKVQKVRYHEILGSPGIVKMHYSKQSRRFIEIERGLQDQSLFPDAPRRRKES